MAGIFITSTGTGIGKTFLVEQLLAWDRRHLQCLSASKPIISGWPHHEDSFAQTDTAKILLAQGKALTHAHIAAISPWRFHAPLAPSQAARLEQKEIDVNALVGYCVQQIERAASEQHLHLIEGVGGVMAPLTQNQLVVDWVSRLACPSLLVVGAYLGTISHTLSAIEVLKQRNIPLLSVVISQAESCDEMFLDTYEQLSEWLPEYAITLLPSQATLREKGLNSLYHVLLQYQFSTRMAENLV